MKNMHLLNYQSYQTPQDVPFDDYPLEKKLQELFPDLICFGIDNFSSQENLQWALRYLAEQGCFVICISLLSEVAPTHLTFLLNQIITMPQDYVCILRGNYPPLQSLLNRLPAEKTFHSNGDQEAEFHFITQYFKTE